jgi:hypothetical protein
MNKQDAKHPVRDLKKEKRSKSPTGEEKHQEILRRKELISADRRERTMLDLKRHEIKAAHRERVFQIMYHQAELRNRLIWTVAGQ